MSAAFTPGPWEVAYTEVHGKRYGIRGVISAAKDSEGNPVLREMTGSHCKSWTEYVVRPEGADADEPDFRLIAAAPGLYDALEIATRTIDTIVETLAEHGFGYLENATTVAAMGRAILAKARGAA